MNLLQSTTLGLLIWLPLSVAIFGVLLGLGTNLVQLLITKFGKLMGDLACGLSGTSSKELEDLLKKYKEELGKKVS